MARYGSQHEIDVSFLRIHACFGHFVSTGAGSLHFRFWDPAEIAMIHGLVQTTYVPDNLQLAWHIVGNQICLPHALLLVADLFFRLHHFDYSPFVVFSQLQLQRFQGRTTHLVDFPGGSFVSLSADIPTNPQVTTLLHCVRESALFTCWHPRSGFEPPIVEDSHPLPAQEAEAVSTGTISPTAYGSLCCLCPNLTVSMPSPFGVMPPSRATHWKPWFDHVRCTFHADQEPGLPCISCSYPSSCISFGFEHRSGS